MARYEKRLERTLPMDDEQNASSEQREKIKANYKALLPFCLFLLLFIGTGLYFSHLGYAQAFYQLPSPVAILPAIALAFILSKDSYSKTISHFIKGVGHENIIAMCLIFLLSGAFSEVAKATGGVQATVNFGLLLLPSSMILPGFFIISAFMATAMGTSMGTIAAIAPIGLGIATASQISPELMAGAILSGSMFGDNLSIISDTTIAATRSQGCDMKDKFKENLFIAAPSAVVVCLLYYLFGTDFAAPAGQSIEWLKLLPYLSILLLAIIGIDVFAVLLVGIIFAGIIGMLQSSNYNILSYANDIYKGFSSVEETFLLSMLIGGLGYLLEVQGGLTFISQSMSILVSKVSKKGKGIQRAAQLSLAGIVSLTNLCTANNTVAIIVSGNVAKELAKKYGVSAKRSASILDIYACVIQGLIPYGAQALLIGTTFSISPWQAISHSYYSMVLAIFALASIFLNKQKKTGIAKPSH